MILFTVKEKENKEERERELFVVLSTERSSLFLLLRLKRIKKILKTNSLSKEDHRREEKKKMKKKTKRN